MRAVAPDPRGKDKGDKSHAVELQPKRVERLSKPSRNYICVIAVMTYKGWMVPCTANIQRERERRGGPSQSESLKSAIWGSV